MMTDETSARVSPEARAVLGGDRSWGPANWNSNGENQDRRVLVGILCRIRPFSKEHRLGRKKASALTMPWCTYTDPEIAHVGLYERDARERGIELDTSCLSGCFSKTPRVVYRRASTAVSKNLA